MISDRLPAYLTYNFFAQAFESHSENRFRGVEPRTERKFNSDIIIITNLGCSLTKKPQIQVSDY